MERVVCPILLLHSPAVLSSEEHPLFKEGSYRPEDPDLFNLITAQATVRLTLEKNWLGNYVQYVKEEEEKRREQERQWEQMKRERARRRREREAKTKVSNLERDSTCLIWHV